MDKKEINDMSYEEVIKELANSDVTVIERGENLIRNMANLIDAILNYKYVVDHHSPPPMELEDMKNTIIKVMGNMMSDADIYMDAFGITKKVKYKAVIRTKKILLKIMRKN